MRFYQGYLKKSGDVAVSGVDKSIIDAQLKSGTIGIQVRIMGPDTKLPDDIKFVEELKEEVEEVKEGEKKESKEEKKPEEKKEAPKETEQETKEEETPKEEVKPEEKEVKKEVIEEKVTVLSKEEEKKQNAEIKKQFPHDVCPLCHTHIVDARYLVIPQAGLVVCGDCGNAYMPKSRKDDAVRMLMQKMEEDQAGLISSPSPIIVPKVTV